MRRQSGPKVSASVLNTTTKERMTMPILVSENAEKSGGAGGPMKTHHHLRKALVGCWKKLLTVSGFSRFIKTLLLIERN